MVDLQELADAINRKWPSSGATVNSDEILWVTFECCAYPHDPRRNDLNAGTWIIWCLDRLEELGREPRLSPRQYGFFRCDLDNPVRVGFDKGKTRAEAVTLALAAALGIDAPGTGHSEPQAQEEAETGEAKENGPTKGNKGE